MRSRSSSRVAHPTAATGNGKADRRYVKPFRVHERTVGIIAYEIAVGPYVRLGINGHGVTGAYAILKRTVKIAAAANGCGTAPPRGKIVVFFRR